LRKNISDSAQPSIAPLVSSRPIKTKTDRRDGERPVLARDIYRDFYRDSGLAIEEKVFLAAKRLCVLFAGCALALALLDFVGVHSLESAGAVLQSARSNLATFGDAVRTGTYDIALNSPTESVRVAIPKFAAKATPAKAASPVDGLAAARTQDAVSLAMTTPTLGGRDSIAAAAQSAAATPSLLDLTKAARSPAQSVAMPNIGKSITVTEAAAKAEASVPPDERLQYASLPALNISAPSLPLPNLSMPEQPALAPAVTPMVMLPLSQVPLPLLKPPLSPADRLGLAGKEYARAERCLANAIYFEARSEPVRGQMAVAQVVLNRVFSGFYPNDVCSVVYQNASRHLACQFTFACDGKSKAINERAQWSVANRIARQTLDGQIYVPEVAKSTHYHAVYVHPNWVHEMKRMVRFGIHSFYRPYAWGSGAEEPVWGTAAMVARLNAGKTQTAAR
jgi:hypothetical protein